MEIALHHGPVACATLAWAEGGRRLRQYTLVGIVEDYLADERRVPRILLNLLLSLYFGFLLFLAQASEALHLNV